MGKQSQPDWSQNGTIVRANSTNALGNNRGDVPVVTSFPDSPPTNRAMSSASASLIPNKQSVSVS